VIGAAPAGTTLLTDLRLGCLSLEAGANPLDERLETPLPADTPPVPPLPLLDALVGVACTPTIVMQISVDPSARNRTATSFVGLRG
jgi:hypothetical protein